MPPLGVGKAVGTTGVEPEVAKAPVTASAMAPIGAPAAAAGAGVVVAVGTGVWEGAVVAVAVALEVGAGFELPLLPEQPDHSRLRDAKSRKLPITPNFCRNLLSIVLTSPRW